MQFEKVYQLILIKCIFTVLGKIFILFQVCFYITSLISCQLAPKVSGPHFSVCQQERAQDGLYKFFGKSYTSLNIVPCLNNRDVYKVRELHAPLS